MDHPRPDWSRYRKMLLMWRHRARNAVVEQLTEIRLFLVSLRAPEGLRASWPVVRPFVVFAVAYIAAWSYLFIAAFLGAKPPPAPLFAPGAVLLCALLLAPPRRWWLYLLVAFVIQVPILAYLHLPLWWNLVGFIPDAVEPVLAVLLLRRYLTLPPRFVSLREASIYTACVTVAVAIAATIGSVVNAIGGEPYWSAWRTWFLGDTLTALILAPTLLLWIAVGARGLHANSRWRYTEVILLYGSLLVIGVAAFDTRFFTGGIGDAAIYLPVPLLLWAAVRFGPRGLVSALSLIVALTIPSVANAFGPFASVSIPAPSVLDQVFQLQLFLLVIGVPLFFLAALIQERQQADVFLQASEARYRAAFESAVTGMMLLSIEGHPLRVNRPLVAMLGYAEDELRPKTLADFTHPDDLELNLAMFRQAVAGEISSYRLDTRFFDKQGHVVWGILSAGVVRDIAGKPLYLVGQIENITERKLLEQEREEARDQAERQAEELDRVFEAMADGVAVYDQDGELLRTNAALRHLLGLNAAPPAFAHLSLPERFALFAARDTHGQPVAPQEGPLLRALRGDLAAAAETQDGRLRTLDGREVELRVSAAPIRAPTGQVVGAVLVYRDVTEPKRMERQLAEQAEQLNRIFEGIADGLVVYDAAGQVLRANATARRILGLDAAPADYDQVSTHGRAVLYEAYDDEGRRLAPEEWPLIRVLQGLVADADARDVRLRVLDGREVEIHTSAAPLRDVTGHLVGAVTILHDQTERRRLEREREEVRTRELAMREVNQRLDIFVTMAAHDLRSPVAVSRMVVQLAQARLERAAADAGPARGTDGALAPALDRAAEALKSTADNLDRLWRLVQQLLDVARVKEGTLALNIQAIDLVELLRTCVEEQRMLNPSREIALDVDVPPHADMRSVIVDADADRLNQVITNYLSNAERYSPDDQPITVALRLAAEEVPDVADAPADGLRERHVRPVARVEVCDHGVGIADEDQVTIWDRFQRAASVDQASGLGLGLYIVRTIVELHRGRVGVQSIPGHGATFWFTVPLLAGSAFMAASDDHSDNQDATP